VITVQPGPVFNSQVKRSPQPLSVLF